MCHIVQHYGFTNTTISTICLSRSQTNYYLPMQKKKLFSVRDAFDKEQAPGFGSVLDRTAKVTGVSRSTVDRVRQEKKETGILLSHKKTVETEYMYKNR